MLPFHADSLFCYLTCMMYVPVRRLLCTQLQGVEALQPVFLLTDPYLNVFRR